MQMLTKDPVNLNYPPLFEQPHNEPENSEPVVTFSYLSRAQLCKLPKVLQRQLQDNLFGALDKHQAARLRDDTRCQYWAKDKEWKKVPYSLFKQANTRLAVYPKQTQAPTKYSGAVNNGSVTSSQTALQNNTFINNTVMTPSTSAFINSQSAAQNSPQFINQQSYNQKPKKAVQPIQQHAPAVRIYKPELNSTMLLKASHTVRQNFTTHVLSAAETVEQLAQQYTGYKNANLIYDYNLGYSERKPAKAGTSLTVPSGWKLNIEGSCSNSRSVVIQWQGPTSGQITLQLEKKRPDEVSFWQHYAEVKPGLYNVTVTASGATDTTTFTVEQPTLAYEIELLDEAGEPQANMGYKIRLRNGHIITGQLDQNGYANVSGPDFENAKVSFFELDSEDWSVGKV
ncbi:hypothetical protein HHE94_12635 [Pseudoalteromonas arctica]|uniref:Uncharacterized protein n=2 Tax=Pseudoalteromonas arctica TaxID=394751 RepID=A0AAP7CME8_9GAMM|nr:hypothetical protein [Pseudoalteromonas arctica]